MSESCNSESFQFQAPVIQCSYPEWLIGAVDWSRVYSSDEEKVRVAIELSRLNAECEGGGPFGAAVFDAETGRLVSVGVNRVVPTNNFAMHAEMMALMMAQARVGSHTLRREGSLGHDLATSSDPCAMCMGATLWSGVSRVICGATGEDAREIGFDEGPVFPASFKYLHERGIRFVREVCREEASAVLRWYRENGGPIYNR